jgi:hypothetical protein
MWSGAAMSRGLGVWQRRLLAALEERRTVSLVDVLPRSLCPFAVRGAACVTEWLNQHPAFRRRRDADLIERESAQQKQPEEEVLHMPAKTDDGKIKIELVRSHSLARHPCNVCGSSERHSVWARGHGLLVCRCCLEAGAVDIDERLERFAASLEATAAATRALIGRLVVPSYAEWQAAVAAEAEDFERYHRAEDIAESAERLAIEHDNIARDPKVRYRVIGRDVFGGTWFTSFETMLGAERFIAEYGKGEIKREEQAEIDSELAF